jgi:hypothetical protein
MKKNAFPIVLAIALTALSPAIGHADPNLTSQPASTSGVTGSDPVPTSPDQWPHFISIVLAVLSSIP